MIKKTITRLVLIIAFDKFYSFLEKIKQAFLINAAIPDKPNSCETHKLAPPFVDLKLRLDRL